MKKILKLLQAIQIKAWEKGVNSFTLNTRWFDDGDSGVIVSIFLEDDTTWEENNPNVDPMGVNYFNVAIYGKLNGKPSEWQLRQVQKVAEIVGVEV